MSIEIRFAAWRFQRDLPTYYEDLASFLASVKDIKMIEVFENDAQRYQGQARGTLSEIWAQRYRENGADLVRTWEDCMPAHDLAVLRATHGQGPKALTAALKGLALANKVRKDMASQATATVGLGAFALIIATIGASVIPLFTVDSIQEIVRVPPDQWGSVGKQLYAWTQLVRSYWMYALGFIALSIAGVIYALSHLIGPLRDWLDRFILIFKVNHQMQAIALAMTLETLTRKTTSEMLTLQRCIELLHASAPTPYRSWQYQRMLDGLAAGEQDCTLFDQVLPKEMAWRLSDLVRGNNLADSFSHLVTASQEIWIPRLKRQLAFWRWVLLSAGLLVAITMTLQTNRAQAEIKEVVMRSMNL